MAQLVAVACKEGRRAPCFPEHAFSGYPKWIRVVAGASTVLPMTLHSKRTDGGYRGGTGYEMIFQPVALEVAVVVPYYGSVTAFRPATQHVVEQWWSLATRNAFRTWPELINSLSGIFLVTETIKTNLVAQCFLNSAHKGLRTNIRVHSDAELASTRQPWTLMRNDMDFKVLQAEEDREYTVFIRRANSRMVLLTDALKTTARSLWAYPLLPPPTVPFSIFFGISRLIADNVWLW
jgi:hypothetical protein